MGQLRSLKSCSCGRIWDRRSGALATQKGDNQRKSPKNGRSAAEARVLIAAAVQTTRCLLCGVRATPSLRGLVLPQAFISMRNSVCQARERTALRAIAFDLSCLLAAIETSACQVVGRFRRSMSCLADCRQYGVRIISRSVRSDFWVAAMDDKKGRARVDRHAADIERRVATSRLMTTQSRELLAFVHRRRDQCTRQLGRSDKECDDDRPDRDVDKQPSGPLCNEPNAGTGQVDVE